MAKLRNQEQLPEGLHTPTAQQIIKQQQHIGWAQLWKGRWSQEWVRQYNQATKKEGEKWATTTIVQLWHILYTQWRTRCETLHDNSNDEKSPPHHHRNTETYSLEPKIQAIYDQKPRLDHIDQTVLSQPIATILRLPHRMQNDWIKRTESFVKVGIKRAKQRIKHRTHSITNFFTRRVVPHRAIPHIRINDPNDAANFRPP
jgi:hypothetical protein